MTIESVILERLRADGMLPPPASGGVALAGASRAVLHDGFRGALAGTAIGDALGRPAEGSRHHLGESARARFSEFQPWHGWTGGPRGTITDDTQLTMCVGESLVATGGVLDPVDLARRFVAWLPVGRGKGRTCTAACRALADGVDWWESAVHDSAGNGAAMRVAPVGLAHLWDLDALRRDAALSAVITHFAPMAMVSAVAHAWLVARLVSTVPGELDPVGLVRDLCAVLADLGDDGLVERDWQRRGGTGAPVRLVDRIIEVPGKLSLSSEAACSYFYCGAFVLETLPMALWHFLSSPEDPERAIVDAVLGGFDADTVASMTGAYAGAYLGESGLPERWRGDDLEFADELRRLADALFAVGV